MTSILVTGSAGLLGAGVSARLASAGRSVIGLDHRLPSTDAATCSFHLADINDVHRLYSIARTAEIEVIVHCGGVSGAMVMRDNPSMIFEINVRGTANILELARAQQVRRLVFCSTIMAYGDQTNRELQEDMPLFPTNVYAASKAACEAMIRGYQSEYGIEGASLRISHVYGPRRRTECFVRQIIEDAHAERTSRLPQSSRSRRQYVYVNDVLDAILLAIDAPRLPQTVYNITGGEEHTLAELVETARRVLGRVDVEFDETNDPPEYHVGKLDITAAARDLGYRPRVTLEQGIAAYEEWLRRNV